MFEKHHLKQQVNNGIEKGHWNYTKANNKIAVCCPDCGKIYQLSNGYPYINKDGSIYSVITEDILCEHLNSGIWYLDGFGNWQSIQELIQEIINPDFIQYQKGFLSEPDTIICKRNNDTIVYWYSDWERYYLGKTNEVPNMNVFSKIVDIPD